MKLKKIRKAFVRFKEEMEIFYSTEKWNRRNLPSMYCKYCDHKENEHGNHICFECRGKESNQKLFHKNKTLIPCHKFNQEPTETLVKLNILMPDGLFQDDHYYMGLLIKEIKIDRLREIELVFGWKLASISVLDKELWISFYKTRIFCTYCGTPALTMQEKIEHEQAGDESFGRCYKKPKEVTFAD